MSNLFLSHYKKTQLPPFWLVRPSNKESITDTAQAYVFLREKICLDLTSTIQSMYQREFENIVDCPDVLILNGTLSSGHYKVPDLAKINHFQQNAPIMLSHKFVILSTTLHLTNLCWNKLLKTLEEPLNSTVIVIPHIDAPLLPTVKSRSFVVHVDLPDSMISQSSRDIAFPNWKQLSIEQARDAYESLTQEQFQGDEKMLLRWLVNRISSMNLSFTESEKILNMIKWCQESLTYHNSVKERALFITSLLKQLEGQQQI